jgi:hypothetical protein
MTMPDTRSGGAQGAGPGDAANRPGTGTAGGSSTGDAGTDPRDQIRNVRDKVVDQAKTTVRQAKERAGTGLEESRRRVAEQIGGIAHVFERCGQELRTEAPAPVARLAESLAAQVERVGNYLREADARRMARDLEELARRQPGVVLAGAFGVGLLAARFLKSSEPEYGSDEASYERIRPGGEPAGLGAGAGGGFNASA